MWLDDKTIVTANYLQILIIDIKSGKIIKCASFHRLTSKKFYPGKIPFFYNNTKKILYTFSKIPHISSYNTNTMNQENEEINNNN